MTSTTIAFGRGSQPRAQNRTLTETVLVVGALTALTTVPALLLIGLPGLFAGVLLSGLVAFGAPLVPASVMLSLYRAKPMDRRNGRDFYRLLGELTERTGLMEPPKLYVIPSLAHTAFTVGGTGRPAIAISEGLLRKAGLAEIACLLAHELAHIRQGDLRLFALADAVARVAQVLAWAGLALLLAYGPSFVAGTGRLPWLPIAILMLSPLMVSQLLSRLSKVREFDADREAASLVGHRDAYAALLPVLEPNRGRFWEDIVLPNIRKVAEPSLLRVHPTAEERLIRIADAPAGGNPLDLGTESPRISLVGLGPSAMRPRYRFPGLWF